LYPIDAEVVALPSLYLGLLIDPSLSLGPFSFGHVKLLAKLPKILFSMVLRIPVLQEKLLLPEYWYSKLKDIKQFVIL
jgi:hypothetical protein